MQAHPYHGEAVLPLSHFFNAEFIYISFICLCFLQQTGYELLPDLLLFSGGYKGLVKQKRTCEIKGDFPPEQN